MTHKIFVFCLFLLAIYWPSLASSGEVQGLYEAKVSIANQSSNAQRSARRSAFREVLVKVSGNRDILRSSAMRAEIAKANSYLLSYRYESKQDNLFYIAEFDRQRVDKLVRVNGFPLWGARRPQTVLWFVVQAEEALNRELIAESSNSEVTEQAKKIANQRGIEVSFPLLDLTDIQQVSVYDVWGGFMNKVVEGSRRYGADIVFSARLYFVDINDIQQKELAPLRESSWIADWSLVNGETTQTGSLIGKSVTELSALLIHHLSDVLGQTYAINTTVPGQEVEKVSIVITNINDLDSYENVHAFLSSLSVVTKARLISQQSSLATFELELLGSENDLRSVFRLDDNINSVKDEFGFDLDEHRYIWNQ